MSRHVSIASLTQGSHDDYDDLAGSESPMLWDMELPRGLDAERITVNMSRLNALHTAGSIAVSFVEEYEGETTGASKEKSELSVGACLDPFDCSYQTRIGEVSLNATFGKAAITHQLNRPEIEYRAAAHLEKDKVTPEKAWADAYDAAIRNSMRQGAQKHLVGRAKQLPQIYRLMMGSSVGALIVTTISLVEAHFSGGAAISYAIMQASPYASDARNRTRAGQTLPRRWSAVAFGMQPDRYLAVNALCRLPGLVKAEE